MAGITRRSLLGAFGGSVAIMMGMGAAQALPGDRFRLRGTVRYGANGALPPGRLTIRLEEHGIMDKPARRIATATVRSSGRRRSVPFEMLVPRAALASAHAPGFTVRLERNGRLIAINTTSQPFRRGRDVVLTIEPILY